MTSDANVESALRRVQSTGWSCLRSDDGRHMARVAGLRCVGHPYSSGDTSVATLEPQDRHDAHPSSLSAIHGRGAFPLHTDGAHHPVPPDLVLMESVGTIMPLILFLLLWRWIHLPQILRLAYGMESSALAEDQLPSTVR